MSASDLDVQKILESVANHVSSAPNESNNNQLEHSLPNIGSIYLGNSSDTTIGNNTYFEGPVTIHQIVYERDKCSSIETPKGTTLLKSKKQCKKTVILASIVFTCIIVALISTGVYFGMNRSEDPITTTPTITTTDNTPANNTESDTLVLVTKNEWKAIQAHGTDGNITHPCENVVISHTVTTECYTRESCSDQVLKIQQLHINQKSDDIGYNFLIGGDGAVYVGRGWDVVGAHTLRFNRISIGIAFIGDFTIALPRQAQLKALHLLLSDGVTTGKLDSQYKIFGHCQFRASKSPGKALYEIIQKFPNWSKTHKGSTNSSKHPKLCTKKSVIIASGLITVIVVALISTGVYFGVRNSEDATTFTTKDTTTVTTNPIATTDNTPTPGTNQATTNSASDTLVFVSRNEWKSLDVNGTSGMLEIPCKNVVIAHTATEECDTRESCSEQVRIIQQLHISHKSDDIGYNFLIGGDDAVYVGRGWDIVGARSYGFNVKSIGIAFIGDYQIAKPTQSQVKSLELLLSYGVTIEKLDPNYNLFGHIQIRPTLSPGKFLYEIITRFPHWSSSPSKEVIIN